MNYPAHDTFVDPARDRPELWRLAAGIALLMILYVGLHWALEGALMLVLGDPGYFNFRATTSSGRTPGGVLFALAGFGFMILAMMAVLHQLHDRSLSSLIGPLPQARTQFTRTLVAVALASLAIWVLPPAEYDLPMTRGLPFQQWLVLLPPALVVLLIQTSAEEIVFRGYLQQQLAARFNTPIVWMLVPSALFAMLHYRPDAGENAVWLILWAGIFGLVAADLTARSGTLGPAIALHLASNISAVLLVSGDPGFSGLALWRMDLDLSDPAMLRPMLMVDAMVLLVTWLSVRLALRR